VDGYWPRESLLEEMRSKPSGVIGSSQTGKGRRDGEPEGRRGRQERPRCRSVELGLGLDRGLAGR